MASTRGNEDITTDQYLSSRDASAYLQIARDMERFEKAWSDGAPFPLEDLLHDRPEAYHGDLLWHALIVELAYRPQRGETPSVASYDWRFPMQLEAIQQAFTEPAAARDGALRRLHLRLPSILVAQDHRGRPQRREVIGRVPGVAARRASPQ
jgi:hypothetical protein